MQPVNKEITELVDTQALEAVPGAERSPDQSLEKRAMKKIDTRRKLHMVRIVVGAGVWIGGLVSFSCGV
ncbi:hypothetical protein FIBSPDRAFT_867914 [Athelia psychrophila]|uniref:Uncharacterized protein n=1 Tax=Athelia psychrophila TaxID=1759441 RepID=A0A166DJM1_9AGAM|nr:hypothetical protein FIBSPDRAFT_867914 [Fibularhizoctonia sp. CBS 109695]